MGFLIFTLVVVIAAGLYFKPDFTRMVIAKTIQWSKETWNRFSKPTDKA